METLSISTVSDKSEEIPSDIHLQYRRASDGTYVFDGDMRETPERYGRKAHPCEDADDKWADPEFPYPPSEFFSNSTTWLRASDIVENPVSFQQDMPNLTVNRGRFETSKFLIVFLTTMEHKELFTKVFPLTQKSQNIIHFRFWYFGQWVDVYIDDTLPVQQGCLLMTSHSAQSDREIGITMAEKAYAKFVGSYTEVERKDFEDFFQGLTGGFAQKYEFRLPIQDCNKVFFKLKDILASGSFIFCTVKSSSRGYYFGKEENLTFSVTGTLQVRKNSNNPEHALLVKLRNIWNDFEWTGPWSHGSSEWLECHSDDYSNVFETHTYEETFFYMDVGDFVQYFDGFTIGSPIPDFSFNGSTNMDFLVNMYGEWPQKDVEALLTNSTDNAALQFSISAEENPVKDTFDIGVILTQKIINNEKPWPMHCGIYKVIDTTGDNSLLIILIGKKTEHFNTEQVARREKLEPGTYILFPSFRKNGQRNSVQFFVRIYSEEALHNIGSFPTSRQLIICGEEGLYQE